jgi:hypothetical protein
MLWILVKLIFGHAWAIGDLVSTLETIEPGREAVVPDLEALLPGLLVVLLGLVHLGERGQAEEAPRALAAVPLVSSAETAVGTAPAELRIGESCVAAGRTPVRGSAEPESAQCHAE